MWKCKTKDIQPYLDIQAYSGIFRDYSGIFWNLCNPGIFRTLVYSKPETYWEAWYIQNSGIFKTRGILRSLVYPKLWHTQNQRHIQNSGLFRTLRYWEPEAYSEPCLTSTMEHLEKQLTATIIFASQLFSQYQLFMSYSSWNKYGFF